MTQTCSAVATSARRRVNARLRPLRLAQLVSGIAPWVPVEKVFMSELGFTPALVAAMAAAYAAVVPLLEIPAGVLADRWSRRGVLILAQAAALLSVTVGALSHTVAAYIVSAMILGVFFALQSGTVDSIVYDTLVEESGTAEGFETVYGRIQAWGSFALTGSAVAGGLIAASTSARTAYLVSTPFTLAAILLLARLREPTLHRQVQRAALRAHLRATIDAVRCPRVAVIVAGSVFAAATLQMTFEFGPLWLLAAGTATIVFGPYTAAMTATLGLGARLTPALGLHRRRGATATAIALAATGLVLVAASSTWLVIAAQTVLAALLVAVGIHLSRLLHDVVPSSTRTGVLSGASTLSWLAFLPASALFGLLSTAGVHAAGWVLVVLAAAAGAALTALARRAPLTIPPDAPLDPARPVPATA